MEFLLDYMALIWLVLAILFAVIEGLTLGFVTIWFTVGAAVSAVCALLDVQLWVQIVVFFAISIVLLLFTRPILVKKLKVGREKNVVDQYAGKSALVTEAIKPYASGLVKADGKVWTAVGEDSSFSAAEGEELKIIRVDGVKLIVGRK
jgi:membrane protein implicated in regulation of membrane protease activity